MDWTESTLLLECCKAMRARVGVILTLCFMEDMTEVEFPLGLRFCFGGEESTQSGLPGMTYTHVCKSEAFILTPALLPRS